VERDTPVALHFLGLAAAAVPVPRLEPQPLVDLVHLTFQLRNLLPSQAISAVLVVGALHIQNLAAERRRFSL
jgi:hypothetical protein